MRQESIQFVEPGRGEGGRLSSPVFEIHDFRRGQKVGPIAHERASFLELLAALIGCGGFRLILVSEGRFPRSLTNTRRLMIEVITPVEGLRRLK
jgi:hypothetical protein